MFDDTWSLCFAKRQSHDVVSQHEGQATRTSNKSDVNARVTTLQGMALPSYVCELMNQLLPDLCSLMLSF